MASEVDDDNRTLYIGNLDKNVTEEILYELFLQAGPIERVSIPCNNYDSYKYGFVTYKHECSIDYSIELYKGTCLYRKELVIKKKGSKNGNTSQQSSELSIFDKTHIRFNAESQDFQDQCRNFQQAFLNSNYFNSPLVNFSSDSLKGSWSNYNKPYDRGTRSYSARVREVRDRRKERDYGNKMYHRKNRHRD